MSGEGYQRLLDCRRRGRHLREQGFTIDQIAIVLSLDHPATPLRLYRYAAGLTAAQVATVYSNLDPSSSILRESRLYDYETWPESGRRPSIFTLRLLAGIYRTQPARLLTPASLARYSPHDRRILQHEG